LDDDRALKPKRDGLVAENEKRHKVYAEVAVGQPASLRDEYVVQGAAVLLNVKDSEGWTKRHSADITISPAIRGVCVIPC